VFNASQSQIASLQATTDQGWVTDAGTYDLGSLTANDSIYFAVDSDGYFYWDGTEIAWTVTAVFALCEPTDCHVETMVCSEQRCGGPNKNGVATITIYDDCDDPVVGAEVTGTFTGDFDEQVMDTTDGNGQAVLVTTGCVKRPTWEVCVDDVDHTLPYDSNDNVVSPPCCND